MVEKRIHDIGLSKVDIVARDVKKKGIGAKKVTVIEKEASHPRNYLDIVSLIDDGALSDEVKKASKDIFSRIADAEAKIHRCEKNDVHFHEVGAVDSIVDIVGAAPVYRIPWYRIRDFLAAAPGKRFRGLCPRQVAGSGAGHTGNIKWNTGFTAVHPTANR